MHGYLELRMDQKNGYINNEGFWDMLHQIPDEELLPSSFFTGAPTDIRPLDTPPLDDINPLPLTPPPPPPHLIARTPPAHSRPSTDHRLEPPYLDTDFCAPIITKPPPHQRLCPGFRPKRPHNLAAMSTANGSGNRFGVPRPGGRSTTSSNATTGSPMAHQPVSQGPIQLVSPTSHQVVAPGTYELLSPGGQQLVSPGSHSLPSSACHQVLAQSARPLASPIAHQQVILRPPQHGSVISHQHVALHVTPQDNPRLHAGGLPVRPAIAHQSGSSNASSYVQHQRTSPAPRHPPSPCSNEQMSRIPHPALVSHHMVIPVSHQAIVSQQMTLPVSHQALVSQQMTLPVSQQALNSQQMTVPVAHQALVSQQMTVPVAHQALVSQQMTLPVAHQALVSQQITVPVAHQALVSQQMTVPVAHQALVSPQMTVPVSQQALASQQHIHSRLNLGNSSYIASIPSALRVPVSSNVSNAPTPTAKKSQVRLSVPGATLKNQQLMAAYGPRSSAGSPVESVLSSSGLRGPARHMLGAIPAPQRPPPRPRVIVSPPSRSLSTQYRSIQPKPPPLIPLPPGYQIQQSLVTSPSVLTHKLTQSPSLASGTPSPRLTSPSVPLNVPQLTRMRQTLHSPPQVMTHPNEGLPPSHKTDTLPVFNKPKSESYVDDTQPMNLTMKDNVATKPSPPSASTHNVPIQPVVNAPRLEATESQVLDFSLSKNKEAQDVESSNAPPTPRANASVTMHTVKTEPGTVVAVARVEENNNTSDSCGKKTCNVTSSNSVSKYEAGENADGEFSWEEYLEEVNAQAAPPTSFKHVEASLLTAFEKGMVLEVPNQAPADSYWPATVAMACGPLLRLQHLGDMSGEDFWCDTCTVDVHPVGWCSDNGKTLEPPEGLKERLVDWRSTLEKSIVDNATKDALKAKPGKAAIDQITCGMWLELQHDMAPHQVWLASVIQNVGGRLLLRYLGSDDPASDCWLFYLSHRIHPIGWGEDIGYCYRPPVEIVSESPNELLQQGRDMAKLNPFPSHLLDEQEQVIEHGGFKEGHKVEAINPANHSNIFPATVVKVIDGNYFIVEIDNVSKTPVEQDKDRMCCHGGSAGVFPVQWCMQKGLRLAPPKGWYKGDFDWREYLVKTNSEAAPKHCFNNLVEVEHQFSRGMKLEVANPMVPAVICAATITRILDSLMWIHLDSDAKIMANHIVDVGSHDIFPVGWCDSNNYPLKPPKRSFKKSSKRVAIVQPEKHMSADEYRCATYTQFKEAGEGTGWCPKIYFNHRCFSGAYLSKGRIAELPKCVGPGPVSLVMKEVLSMLINVAYKSSRVLRELQQEGEPNPNMQTQILKAKYKGKSYRAKVEICKTFDEIEEFCRQVCIKLECCPNLISTVRSGPQCLENCWQLTKTKYSAYFGKKKKRKIGRPPGGHTNLENGPRKPGKRGRGHYRRHLLAAKTENEDAVPQVKDSMESGDLDSNSTGSTVGGELDIADNADNIQGTLKRKYQRHVPAPLEMQTRGVKLPKYSFDMKHRGARFVIQKEEGGTKKRRGRPPKEPPTPSPTVSVKTELSPSSSTKEEGLKLTTNPLHWSVAKAVSFIKTTDCAHLAHIFKEQEIDGQALLLLSLPAVQEHMDLKLGPAIKLCHHIERVKIAFFQQWAS